MTKIKSSVTRNKHHKKIKSAVKGFSASNRASYRRAKEALSHAMRHSFRHRRQRKGDFRKLWILRINAATRVRGLSYNQFISGLKASGIELNSKTLAQLSINDTKAFDELTLIAKEASTIKN